MNARAAACGGGCSRRVRHSPNIPRLSRSFPRERAALAWTDAITNLRDGHVPDDLYRRVQKFFSEKELADLTLAVAGINAWNRLNIAGRTVPGGYRPARKHEAKQGA